MKREVTVYICDNCGAELPISTGSYTVSAWEDGCITVKAMFYNARVGSKRDLCPKCTAEIVEQWLKEMKRDGQIEH